MRPFRSFSIAIAMLLSATSSASGWGNQGHQAIAEAAQSRLTGRAHAGLAKILIGGTTTTLPPGKLAAMATWADEIRVRRATGAVPAGWDDSDIAEADEFNATHRANARWHFVNLPLAARSYDGEAAAPFRSDDDIVHAVNRAIAVLESESPTAGFSRRQAVRWLVHLVADLHQPTHVATGYYAMTSGALADPKLIREPMAAARPGVVSDRGGNGLLFAGDAGNLHAVWDGCLVERVSGARCTGGDKPYLGLAKKLVTLVKSPDAAASTVSGDHRTWAAQWAADSVKAAVAAEAYTVKLTDPRLETTASGDRFLQATIGSPSKRAYVDARIAAARRQLVKAAARLADLLNAIDWK